MSATPNGQSSTPVPPNAAQTEQQQQQRSPPQNEFERIREELREKSHVNRLWTQLVEEAERIGDQDRIKEAYDALLEAYPNTASAQITYLNYFLNAGAFSFAEKLFGRFLRASPSVELWRFYLVYVRRVNVNPSARQSVKDAYEFALLHIGQDKDSGEIWKEYLDYVKSGDTKNTWEEQQVMDQLRKIYQRAVQIPLENVEALWREYDAFENNLNKVTAKKFLSDLSPAYQQARLALRDLKKHLVGLGLPPPTSQSRDFHLPSPPTFEGNNDRALVVAWKNYLKWEESNPLEIEEKDKAVLTSRLLSVYRKAVVRCRFFGEIWYMAHNWSLSQGKKDEAVNYLKEGLRANPTSFVINFAYAEALELASNFTEVHSMYDKFIVALHKELDSLAPTQPPPATVVVKQEEENGTGDSFVSVRTDSDSDPARENLIREKREELGSLYIAYMRFARRAEGLKPARAVFTRARRDRNAVWQVYEAAALMEYHCTKAIDVASRIFEKGMEAFGKEVDFVERYLGFLISVNDENNARALFERIVADFPTDKARPIWDRWARYEYQYGDLTASLKLESRMAEAFPNDSAIKRFGQRHTYLKIDSIVTRDLGIKHPTSSQNTNINGSSSTSTLTVAPPTAPATRTDPPTAPAAANKRQSSPRRDDRDGGGPPKRPRGPSPSRDRDRDWDHYDGRGDRGGRRRSPPPRRRSPPRGEAEREREAAEKGAVPPLVSWFIGQMPVQSAFDGPIFRTDDMAQLIRNSNIPGHSQIGRGSSPPRGPRGGGRPPPDYSPYQGPGGGRGRRH